MRAHASRTLAARLSLLLFLVLEIALFPKVQESTAYVWSYMAYLSVVLVALFTLFACRCKGAAHLVRLGIILTLLADYFIVIEYNSYTLGVEIFLIVQLSYFVYLILREERASVRFANFLTRILLCGVLLFAAYATLGGDADTLSLVSAVYYANLLTNIFFAFMLGRKEMIFAIGLTLFALCDLCVGIESLAYFYLNTDISRFFYTDSFNLSWLFYQPSQVLIALSLYFKNE